MEREYAATIVRCAERWADLMEADMKLGSTIAVCAESCFKVADTWGITCNQYGVAVNYLASFWVHGRELNDWHNGQYGVGPGKESTVNPALLIIETPEG